jgi:hypothetical protein
VLSTERDVRSPGADPRADSDSDAHADSHADAGSTGLRMPVAAAVCRRLCVPARDGPGVQPGDRVSAGRFGRVRVLLTVDATAGAGERAVGVCGRRVGEIP